jgi:methylated-DNA-protein-cysteine methyltransferase-like protein
MIALDKPSSDQFRMDVYAITRLIPEGRVSSYGAIAASIGSKGSARRVGWVLNGSFDAVPSVPAHRVVNRLGLLTGRMHFPENMPMDELLIAEGVQITGDRVLNFEELHWDPMVECEIE